MEHLVRAPLRTDLVISQRGQMALLALFMLAFAACGGGGGKGKGNGGGVATVTISGTLSYEFVPPNASCNGLNFAGIEVRPIRGVTVQLLDAASGTEIARTTSSSNGSYSIAGISQNETVRLRVRAELKDSNLPGWDVEVRDNFIAGASDFDVPAPPSLGTRALYVLEGNDFGSGTANVTRNLTATSGWDGASYSDPRASAPFAILDTIYTVMQFVRANDASADFAPLDAFWSVNNKVQTNGIDLTAGELSTSSFYPSLNSLFILGDDADDTDEFDDHLVAHEWGHYFEQNFSRSDSVGGSHFLGESLVANLAFSEGWASAFAGIALDDPIYCDTGVPGTAEGGGFSAETVSFGTKGWFNELSVITFIYDLWDSNNDGTDNGSLGFAPIYNVMTGPQAVTESITSVFSFAAELRSSLNAQGQALVDSQLARENIFSGPGLDIWGTSETNDGGLAQDVLPLHVDYTADGSILNVCVNSTLDGLNRHGNNIGEDRFIRVTVPADDQYDVSVVTTTPTPVSADPTDRDQSDPDIYIIRGSVPELLATGTEPDENFEPTFRTPMMFAAESYVALLEEWRFDDFVAASTSFPQRICFDISFTPTP